MENWLSSSGPDDKVCTCVITRGEVLFGIERLAAGRRRTEPEGKASRLFTVIPCEAIPVAAGDGYASLKREQQGRGLPLDENDLWIAATALALGTTLVSVSINRGTQSRQALSPRSPTEASAKAPSSASRTAGRHPPVSFFPRLTMRFQHAGLVDHPKPSSVERAGLHFPNRRLGTTTGDCDSPAGR
jgi:predicted nucleic acid-binding protein